MRLLKAGGCLIQFKYISLWISRQLSSGCLIQVGCLIEVTTNTGLTVYHGPHQEKKCLRTWTKHTDADQPALAKFHLGLCSSFTIFCTINDSHSWQLRPWSDCNNAQADLGLCSQHMPEDKFSHCPAHVDKWT